MRDRRRGFVYQTLPALNALRLRFDGRDEADGKRLSLNTALGIYLVLTELANEARGDDFQASHGQIATLAGSTRQTVARYVAAFVAVGVVEAEKMTGRNGDEPHCYALVDPEEGGISDDTQVQSEATPMGAISDDTEYKKKNSSRFARGERERAGARLKISGRAVDPETWRRTEFVLKEFNEQAGMKLRLLSSNGEPSEAAKRVYSRIAKYVDLKFEDYCDIIRRTLASKWWGDGAPSIGVVFGPKVFEDNITRPGVPKNATKAEKDSRTDEDLAAMQRVMARAKGQAE